MCAHARARESVLSKSDLDNIDVRARTHTHTHTHMTLAVITGVAVASLSAIVGVFAFAASLGAFGAVTAAASTAASTAWLVIYASLAGVSSLVALHWRVQTPWQRWHDVDVFVNGTAAANVLMLVVLVCEIHVFGVLHDTALCLPIIMLLALLPSVVVTSSRRQRLCGAPRLTHSHVFTATFHPLPPQRHYTEATLHYST